MKAITVWQPWASLIAEGIKTIETRPKQHPWRSAIGTTIAIHAAKRCDATWIGGGWAVGEVPNAHHLGLFWTGESPDLPNVPTHALPLGAVVATCRLVDVVPIDGPFGDHTREGTQTEWIVSRPDSLQLRSGPFDYDDIEEQRPFGDFTPGRWALLLDRVVKLPEAIPCRGYQGLWSLPDDASDELVQQVVRHGLIGFTA